jgi:hypothetical protein
MGLRRAERQAASKRPAAKLGGGGGWNLKDRDPADLTPAPSYPGTSAGASRPWEVPKRDRPEPRSTNEAVRSADDALISAGPKKRAFSGKGWRAAAPGFDASRFDARDSQPECSTEPKVLVGNLPTDVAPETLREILETACAGVDLGDAAGELLETRVAVFGPARPKLRRDKKRLHRGFAVLEYSTRAAAVAAAKALHATELHTPSRKTEGGLRAVKASADVGPAMDAAFLNGEQGEDAILVTEDSSELLGASRRVLAPSAPGKGDPFHDPEIHDPDHPAYDASPPFAMRELALFPMRHSCLATHATVADLDAHTIRPRFFRYLRDAVPGAPELAAAVRVVARVAPRWTRVKELVESVEAFRHALAFLAEAEGDRGGRVINTCFDMACGHGLVGVLFAYAFPEKTARACDWARRPAFDAYARVFGALAACEAKGERFDYRAWESANASRIDAALEALAREKKAFEGARIDTSDGDAPDERRNTFQTFQTFKTFNPKLSDAAFADGLLRTLDETLPGETLGNVCFTLGDLVSLEPLVNRNAFVMALHGCNESTRDALALARRANAPWCVMPCCVVKDLYAPECVLSNLDDATRYAFLCGVLAHKYGASLVRSVDRRITNRPVMLFGGLSRPAVAGGAARAAEGDDDATGAAPEGVPSNPVEPAPPAGPFTLRFPMAHKRLVSRVAARRQRAGKEEGGTG